VSGAAREGGAVDRSVVLDVELARVAHRLRILEGDPRQQRDLVLREAELAERGDADGVGEPVQLADARQRRLERGEAGDVRPEPAREPRVALGACRGVVLADRRQQPSGEGPVPRTCPRAMLVEGCARR
jgi:hypothetical protein